MAPRKSGAKKGGKKGRTLQPDGELIFAAECILAERVEQRDGRDQTVYLVKFEDFDESEAEWLTEYNIGDELLSDWSSEKQRLADLELEEAGVDSDGEDEDADESESEVEEDETDDEDEVSDDDSYGPADVVDGVVDGALTMNDEGNRQPSTDVLDGARNKAIDVDMEDDIITPSLTAPDLIANPNVDLSNVDCILASKNDSVLLLNHPHPVTQSRGKPFWCLEELIDDRLREERKATLTRYRKLLGQNDADGVPGFRREFFTAWLDEDPNTTMLWPRTKGSLWLSEEKHDMAFSLAVLNDDNDTWDDLRIVFPDGGDVGITLAELKKRQAEADGQGDEVDEMNSIISGSTSDEEANGELLAHIDGEIDDDEIEDEEIDGEETYGDEIDGDGIDEDEIDGYIIVGTNEMVDDQPGTESDSQGDGQIDAQINPAAIPANQATHDDVEMQDVDIAPMNFVPMSPDYMNGPGEVPSLSDVLQYEIEISSGQPIDGGPEGIGARVRRMDEWLPRRLIE